MMLGLRIDVDTLPGLARGVPRLLSLFEELGLRGTFFVPMGPDRMGRNAKRIIGEKGLGRSVRGYGRVYHWQTLLNGTLRTPANFVDAGARMMLNIRRAGHEVGLHSFDHYGWQTGIVTYSRTEIERDIRKSIASYSRIFGSLPSCWAAPGWRTTELSLRVQDRFGFRYASDARGFSPFYPSIGEDKLNTLQIPVSLPTLDELILQGGNSLEIPGSGLHVYCAHAEVEGLSRLGWFRDFLKSGLCHGVAIVPLSTLARRYERAPGSTVREGKVPGRSAAVTLQVRT
jgi:undecaprenyl phosphate-alpha-L-ara4FN deformylase